LSITRGWRIAEIAVIADIARDRGKPRNLDVGKLVLIALAW
jgi:hypothetical protein